MSKITVDEAIVLCNAFVDSLDADSPGSPGFVTFFGGTVPTTAAEVITTQPTIVTIVLQATSFGDASAGGPGAQALISGTPSGNSESVGDITFARFHRGNGTVMAQEDDITLTSGDGKIKLTTLTSSAIGQPFTFGGFYWQQPLVTA